MKPSAKVAVVCIMATTTMGLAGCGAPKSADSTTNDIATDATSGRVLQYYYLDGDDVVRTICPDGTTLFNRDTCRREPTRVPKSELYKELAPTFGGDRPSLETLVNNTYIRIGLIDDKLVQILDGAPAVTLPDLKPQIAAKEVELLEVERQVAAFADQIARIEDELAHGEDADLRMQWRLLNDKRGELLVARETLKTDLNTLRERFIVANASIFDPPTFEALIKQRRVLQNDLASAQRRLVGSINEAIKLNRAFKYLEDNTFVYEHMMTSGAFDTQPVAAALEYAFDRLDLRLRTFPATLVPGHFEVVVEVTRTGPVEMIECAFTYPASVAYKIVAVGPGGFRSLVDGVGFRVSAGSSSVSDDFERVLGWPGRGTWRFQLTGTNPPPMQLTAKCTVVVGHER